MPNDVDVVLAKILSALHRVRERLASEAGACPPGSGRGAVLCRRAAHVGEACSALRKAIPTTTDGKSEPVKAAPA